ncbi:DUF3618 domain-containing protein [Streptomyces sp. KR80]|uniref:DUF3618 domain-containing protein n=1 Tax=Streptomyces sp. KR80 TaxID=3457426 RepID=UPI003FD33033
MSHTPEEMRGQVIEARERLAATVEQLAAKADVKSRVQHKAADVREQVRHTASDAAHRVQDKTPAPVRAVASKAADTGRRRPAPAAVVAGLALVAVLVVRGRRGRSRRLGGGRS